MPRDAKASRRMTSPPVSMLQTPRPIEPQEPEDDPEIRASLGRNFKTFVAETCLQRWGWVFKTESTIIPALALELGAGPVMLSLFPVLSRGCGFLPQIFFARLVESRPRKKPLLMLFNVLSAALWACTGIMFILGTQASRWGMLWAFLGLYGLSWICLAGLQVSRSAILGKLIPADHRGRLAGAGVAAGGLGSAAIAWWVIRPLLIAEDRSLASFGLLFLAVAAGFLLVVLALSWLREPPRHERPDEAAGDSTGPHADQADAAGNASGPGGNAPAPRQASGLVSYCAQAGRLLLEDANYRRTVILKFTFMTSFSIMVFYTAFAKELISPERFLPLIGIFLTFQVGTQALLSPLLGVLADRVGNRFVLRMLAVVTVVWPLTAVAVARFVPDHPLAYLPVYLIIGAMFPTSFITINYLLEIAPQGRQATYVGTANSIMTLVVLVPPLIGWLIAQAGYVTVFCGVAVTMLPGTICAFRLEEPRQRAAGGDPAEQAPVPSRAS